MQHLVIINHYLTKKMSSRGTTKKYGILCRAWCIWCICLVLNCGSPLIFNLLSRKHKENFKFLEILEMENNQFMATAIGCPFLNKSHITFHSCKFLLDIAIPKTKKILDKIL